MSLLAVSREERTARVRRQLRQWLEGVPLRLAAMLRALGMWMERHRWGSLAVLLALYLPMVLVEAHARPLLNDEIYTLHIARMPTLRAMWEMEREIDLHPPLHYLLERAALHLPGPIWLVARAPSLLAGAVATAVLFLLLSRRLGSVLGWVAVAVLWTGPAAAFFWSNRPYMSWLMLLLLLVVAYLRGTREGRRGRDVALVWLLSALVISDQLIGIAVLGAFALAEGVRLGQRRRMDWSMLLALISPAVIAVGFVYQLRHLQSNAFPAAQIPTVGWAMSMYGAYVTQMFFLLSVTAVVGAYTQPGLSQQRVVMQAMRTQRLPGVEGTVYAGFLLVPIGLMLVAVVAHVQYWERYSLCAVLGLAGLVPWMLYRRVPRLEVLGPLLLLVFVGTTIGQVVDDAMHNAPVAGRSAVASLDASLPVVTANPMTFTEMSTREPLAVAKRVYYLTDRAEAQRVSGYTLFENEDKIARLLELPSHAEDAGRFYRQHAQFWLIANPKNHAEWLLDSLVQRGATVAWKGKIQPGYDDSDLYLVTVPGSVTDSGYGAVRRKDQQTATR